MNTMLRSATILSAFAWTIASASFAAGLELKKGDHICLIGNALADRMQHDGWLESYIQFANPDKELVIRNLGFSGDRVASRPRAHKEFGDPDTHLTHSKADVIFTFFGYNESYKNNAAAFKDELAKFIDETKTKNYSGKGAPQIVLFSPIAFEDMKTKSLPDGKEHNKRLKAYSDVMAEVAKAKDVLYVDIFTPTLELYGKATKPLTLNGCHLSEDGNRQLAAVISSALFGKAPESGTLEKLRQAVVDKDLHWFNRYRATDGNDVWGGRSNLHGNKAVLQNELVMLDAMTANRDKRVWALARGSDLKVDDSNVPKPLPVTTNFKPGGKNGAVEFVTGKDSIGKMTLEQGLKANVFATEEMFPELINPVQLGVDTKGRLWAAVWPTYPKWEPMKEMNDALVILPDDNGDGVADRCITFARVHNPTGFEFWNGGVIVVSAPDILFLKDTDGDDKADVRVVLFQGLDSADTHHAANNLVYGPDGFIYYQSGVFFTNTVESPWEEVNVNSASGMYRFNPRTFEYGFHAGNGPNPHGISFDYWGYHFATDGTSGNAKQVVADGKKGFTMRPLLTKKVRPVPSSGILSSEHFPEKYNGNFLILNSIAFLGIKQYKLSYTPAGEVNGTELEDLMKSSDGNFRPTDFEVAQDGALYVSDWSNPLIGHMQHNIRDPLRDHVHGRVYRITVDGRPLAKPVKVDGEPIEKLLDLLKHPINGVRHRVRVELSGRDTKDVVAATQTWVKQFDPKKPDEAHHMLEGLWLYQQHDVDNPELLKALLESPVENARNAAQRVKYMLDLRKK